MAKHTVKVHKWNLKGILETFEHVFDTRAAAHSFISTTDCHSAKIYNADGNMVSEVVKTPAPAPTYA